MKRDFILIVFSQLLKAILDGQYRVQTLSDFLQKFTPRVGILRHDVDRSPINALKTANIENQLGIRATYYFRIVRQSFDEAVIKEIAAMGHEIGYHYEDLTWARGDPSKALNMFKKNLETFRNLYPVKTICMHGSPLLKCNNRKIWEIYDYRDFGIVGEPYYDVDFTRVLYLADTGRRWDGAKISIRDRVKTNANVNINIRTTLDLIQSLENQQLPDQIMINIHPQRWHNAYFPWGKQLVFQYTKNIFKRMRAMSYSLPPGSRSTKFIYYQLTALILSLLVVILRVKTGNYGDYLNLMFNYFGPL